METVFWCLVGLMLALFVTVIYCALVVASDTDDAMEIYAERVMTNTTPVPAVAEDHAETERRTSWARYSVPLDDDLQRYIEDLCIEHEIPASIVFAVIETETHGTFDTNSMGDPVDGYYRSFGLMQILESEHHDRCLRLNAYNLLDPYQNVRVGIDYLAELIGPNWYDGDWKGALSFYNGDSTGTYAKKVLNRAEQLAESTQNMEG